MTERESEIARLVAQGLPTKAIAAQLVISDRTVQSHLTRIFAKLDLSNRTELATMVLRMETSG